MTTIAERAKKHFPECVVQYPTDDIPYNKSMSDRRLGYIKGANEQKMIDIDKALNYWHKILDSQGINQIVFQDFKKAMEE